MSELMTKDEVAKLLECSVSTVERLARDRVIPSFKVGWLRRYRRASIMEFLSKAEKDTLSGRPGGSGAKVTQIGRPR